MKEDKPLRLCVDCAHFIPGPFGEHRYAKCGRTVSPVHGGARAYCIQEREGPANQRCGERGWYFERKPSQASTPSRIVAWLRKVW